MGVSVEPLLVGFLALSLQPLLHNYLPKMCIFLTFWPFVWELSESLGQSRTAALEHDEIRTPGRFRQCFSREKHTVSRRVFLFHLKDQYSFDSKQKGEPERHRVSAHTAFATQRNWFCVTVPGSKRLIWPLFPSFCFLFCFFHHLPVIPIDFSSNKNICKIMEASWLNICCFNFQHIQLILWRLLVSVRYVWVCVFFFPWGLGIRNLQPYLP